MLLTDPSISTCSGLLRKEERAVCDFLTERLARYKLPRSIIVLDSLPLTAIGKLDKKLLSSMEN
jgi:acyl-CoA synthetase (AMP-forming)/AMP-acid ligase II